jgi:hypothetical protein
LSHKYSNGSSIGVSRSAKKNAANSGRFELSRPTLLYCFFFFLLKLLYPAPILPEPSPTDSVANVSYAAYLQSGGKPTAGLTQPHTVAYT